MLDVVMVCASACSLAELLTPYRLQFGFFEPNVNQQA